MKSRTDIELRMERLQAIQRHLRRTGSTEAQHLVAASLALVQDALAWTLGTHGAKRHDKTFACLARDAGVSFEPREVSR